MALDIAELVANKTTKTNIDNMVVATLKSFLENLKPSHTRHSLVRNDKVYVIGFHDF